MNCLATKLQRPGYQLFPYSGLKFGPNSGLNSGQRAKLGPGLIRGDLEPSAIARAFPTSMTGDVTSEIAEDDSERGSDNNTSLCDVAIMIMIVICCCEKERNTINGFFYKALKC